MGIVMDMSSYETESDPKDAEYGEEVLCAGWNPAVALSQQQPVTPTSTSMPAGLASTDAESFLQRMYACQR